MQTSTKAMEIAEAPKKYEVEVVETITPAEESEAIRRKIEELKSMGFTKAAEKAMSAHNMVIAYGMYTFISQETVDRFNEKLKRETLEEDSRARRYKMLKFIPIEKYGKVPPQHVLDNIARAKAVGIFDSFEVGKIDWVEEVKDPIVFGRINGCSDRFYIAQWDNDVSIEELLSI